MKLESYITMMDAFLKRRLAMTMNHGVQQEHLVLRKEGKNTETYVIILNMSGELISLTVQRKVYVMRNASFDPLQSILKKEENHG
ncbi:hypothetical protein DXA23_04285 [Phocaeicola vulgatus]|nr:hypothetical protein DXA23_04285 [Phocaeicola vulgatus]